MSDKETAAYHEAGHAAIGYLCYGERIGYVKVKTFEEDGSLKHGRVHWKEVLCEEPNVAVAFAGDLAERILEKDCPITYETAEKRNIIKETKNGRETVKYDPEWFKATVIDQKYNRPGLYEEIRDKLKEKWQAVEALAAALLKEETIQGKQAEEILRRNQTAEHRLRNQ